MSKIFALIVLLGAFSFLAPAQVSNPDKKLDWWGDVDGFYNQQHKVTLQLVDEALCKYPPSLEEPMERKMAMLMLDGVLHEEEAAKRPAVQDFLKRRIHNAIEEITSTEVEEGAMIWKMYNHGFVVRTASVTIGFDLVPGNPWGDKDFSVDREIFQKLADACDILFISHRHGDHADEWVAQSFIDIGKPVIAPPEVWKDKAIYKKVLHLPREPHNAQSIKVQEGKQELSLRNYPGCQGSDIENNVPVVTTPEGMAFVHTGDQSGPEENWRWIDEMGEQRIDVLFPNCWTPDIHRMIKGADPELVITGHENEMGHSVDHRESNWLTYTRLEGASKPFLLMAWGEAYHYNVRE